MKIQELIEDLNAYCKANDIYCIDDLGEELYQMLKNHRFKFVTTLGRDEHRWYVLDENVYELSIDGKTYYLGVWEVETIKSECMTVRDCECVLSFCEMEKYTTVSYRVKKNVRGDYLTAKDIKDFKENVIEQIADEYAVSADAARKAVNESFLVKALSIDPEETIHSSIDDWARYVYENHIKE